MILVTHQNKRIGVVATKADLDPLYSHLPEGAAALPINAVRGEDGQLYQVTDLEPLRELTLAELTSSKSARKSALAKLTAPEKAALGVDSGK